MQHTLGEVINKYLFDNEIAEPQQSVCRKLSQAYGDMNVEIVNSQMLYDYIHARLSEAAVATVHRELAVLSKVMDAARDWGWIDLNPVKGVKRPKGVVLRERWLTQDEEDRLLVNSPPWVANIIEFALQTGMRRGEILDLTWDRVNLIDKYILVDRSKNGDRRTIPMTDRLLEMLLRLNGRLVSDKKNAHVLLNVSMNPVTKNELSYEFVKAAAKAGMADLHFHDLRHTYATRLIQRGAELYSVQRLLGHRNPKMTQRYAHHNVDSLRFVVNLLQNPVLRST